MRPLKTSPLETALLAVFHELYGDQGFPLPGAIQVVCRKNTGGGRFVDLESVEHVRLDDGYVDLAGRYVKMSGLPNGLMAVALIKNKRLQQIELTVYGGDFWDGDEREWAIVSSNASNASNGPGSY